MSSTFLARTGGRHWLAVLLVVGAGLLASCGGGTPLNPYQPTRLLAFGDELSWIGVDGSKYTVNAFAQVSINGVLTDDPTTLDCTRNPLWIQAVATSYGLPFDKCQGTATTAGGQILAQPGNKVGDLAAQIAAVQGAPLSHQDMALVMIGMNDILELYADYPRSSAATLIAEAQNRGSALGAQINQLALRGPAVVVLTVPDIGQSPFALAQNVSTGDATRSALLTQLVTAFNDKMSVALINDGRLIGLVYADIEILNEARFPSTVFGATYDVVDPACSPSAILPACNTSTLAFGATTATYMWADSLRPGPVTQARIGSLAGNRAHTNPF
jgi:outer membrane lipase/esterase